MRCGNLACTGKPFTEHRNIPDLRPDRPTRGPSGKQAADKLRAAIQSADLAPGDAAGGEVIQKGATTLASILEDTHGLFHHEMP